MPVPYTIVPGVVAANTVTDLPANAPKYVYLTAAVDAEVAGSATAPAQLTVVYSGTPAAGNILLAPVSSSTRTASWNYGTATTADTVLTLYGYVEGEVGAVA